MVVLLHDPRMVSEDGSLTAECDESLRRMFDAFADNEGAMSPDAVDSWLLKINGAKDRGSEMRAAHAAMRPADADENNPLGDLSWEGFRSIYETELAEGKYWGVAHDLWATDSAEPCLPSCSGKSNLELGEEIGTFKARFDYLWFSTAKWRLVSVRPPPEYSGPCPNDVYPSDHYAIGATLELL